MDTYYFLFMCLITFSIADESQDNRYDIPYLYGRKTMSTRGRILLTKEPLGISIISTIVAFFEENNTNMIKIQMWYSTDQVNYTLDWETEITPTGQTGRTVIALPTSEHFATTASHRLGIYSLADPCPILYEISNKPQVLFSQTSYENSGGPAIRDYVPFETLRLPVRFAIAACNTTDCDVLPVPLTTPTTTVTTNRRATAPVAGNVKERVVVQSSGEDAQFLKEDIVLGLIVWLIILSFIVFAIFFLLICLFFRPKRKQDNDDGDQVGEWWLSVEEPNGGLAKNGAGKPHNSVATVSSDQASTTALP